METATQFGEVEYKGKILKLTQMAYMDTIFRHNYAPKNMYVAHAIDSEDNDYQILWEIIRDCEDESLNCDWDEYEVKEQ